MSKENIKLATKIIEQHGNVQKHSEAGTYYADLTTLLGLTLGSAEKKKTDAVGDMAKQLAGELDSGALVLSDTWEKDNLA